MKWKLLVTRRSMSPEHLQITSWHTPLTIEGTEGGGFCERDLMEDVKYKGVVGSLNF